MTTQSNRVSSALVAAAISGIVALLCQLTLVQVIASPSVLEGAIVILLVTSLTFGASIVGGRLGFTAPWILHSLLWTIMVIGILIEDSKLADTIRHTPNRFVLWSALALPLSCGIMHPMHAWSSRNIRCDVILIAAWLCAAVGAAYIGRFALDVGGTPLQSDMLTWLVGLCLPIPYLLSVWMIHRVRSTFLS